MSSPTEYTSIEYPSIILIDGIIQALFQGIILAQGVKYWESNANDSRAKKYFVGTLISFSIVQTALQCYKVWRTTIFLECWSTSPLQWSDIFLNSVVSSFAEAFYIRRCWKITCRKLWVLLPLSFLLLSIMTASIYLSVASQKVVNALPVADEALRAGRYLLPSTVAAFTYWIFGSLALDLTVTSILITCLLRSRTGFDQSDQLVWHVITITWEAAVPPSLFMLIAGSLYHATPNSRNHVALFFVLLTGKLYTLGLLRTLNSRAKLRERLESYDLGRRSLGNCDWIQETSPVDPLSRPSIFNGNVGSTPESTPENTATAGSCDEGNCLTSRP